MKIFLCIISTFCFLLVGFYIFFDGRTLLNEWRYRANADRSCDKRADPVRFEIRDVVFSIPADLFLLRAPAYGMVRFPPADALKHCDHTASGGDSDGGAKNCTRNHQKVKTFQTSQGKVDGFCQASDEPPFLIDSMRLEFEKNKNEESRITISAEGKPSRAVKIEWLSIDVVSEKTIEKICHAASPVKFFGNPAIIECDSNMSAHACAFTGVIGKNIRVFGGYAIKQNEIPMEYWSSYASQLENLLKKYMPAYAPADHAQICN